MDKLTYVVILIAIIALGPILTIWSLNTLFNTGIEMNIYTWVATLWLGSFFSYTAKSNK